MTRHPAAAVIAFWGVLNVALSSLMFVFTLDLMSHVVYWLANAAVFVVALLALRARNPPMRVLPEASAGALTLAVALALMSLAAGVGSWALFTGGAVLLVAVVLLAMERWA
jgi:hypothetical protein